MAGETNLSTLLKGLTPKLHEGEYVFSTVDDVSKINRGDTICEFQEEEGTTIILEKGKAEEIGLSYGFVASWITLQIHSSLDAVGLTAVFSTALGKSNISCNVIAGYYHDHIFVETKDAPKAMDVLNNLSKAS